MVMVEETAGSSSLAAMLMRGGCERGVFAEGEGEVE